MFYQKINSLNRPHLFTRARTEQIFERTNFLPMSPVLALPGTGEILLHVVLFTLFFAGVSIGVAFFLPKPRNLALRFYVANYAKTGTVRS